MSVEIKSEIITVGGVDATVVSVKNGEAAIGTCDAGYIGLGGTGTKTKIFFVGSDPVANILCPNNGSMQSDKLISLCPGYSHFDHEIKKTIEGCYDRLCAGADSVASCIHEILGLLEDGVYALYYSEYYPTDGGGNYFWGAYNIPHDVHGTAEQNRMLKNNVFKPCFLIPSQGLDQYSPKAKNNLLEKVKKRNVQGIVYHISGFHSVLLKGHHESVACVESDVPFTCLVIEKIYMPYADPIVIGAPTESTPPDIEEIPENVAADAESGEVESVAAEAPKNVIYPEGITGFRGASIKIPLELFPKDMMKFLISGKRDYKPRQFDSLVTRLTAHGKKAVTNNVLDSEILLKADAMPDYDMLESAYAVRSLTDDQLNSLLAGDVECNGEIIISPNFYSSIMTACNFLLFTDVKRFVDFAIAVMDNPELIAAHDYIAHRALSQSTNTKLQKFFQNVVDSEDAKYAKVMEAAETFLRRYMERG